MRKFEIGQIVYWTSGDPDEKNLEGVYTVTKHSYYENDEQTIENLNTVASAYDSELRLATQEEILTLKDWEIS